MILLIASIGAANVGTETASFCYQGVPKHLLQLMAHACLCTRNRPDYFRAYPIKIAKIHNYYSQKRPDGTIDNNSVKICLRQKVEGPGIAVLKRLNADHYGIGHSPP